MVQSVFQLQNVATMKTLTLVLPAILTLCQLSPTLQNGASLFSTKNYKFEPLYLLQPNYLTTSINDVSNYLTKNGYQEKTTLGFVAKTTRDCNGDANLVPVYRFSNNDKYILSRNESPPNDTTLAYAADGIVFYASATMNEDCGPTVPLHSYWVQAHYVYTTDRTMDVLLQMDGGVYRGIVCHIWLNDEPTVTTTTVPTIPTTTVSPHKCQINPVALQRLYRSKSDNHFYTTSEPQADNATARGYVRQKSPGKVAKSETDCNCEYNFIPIYRVHYADHNSLLENYFFTERREEANKFVSVYGYNNEGIEFYCSRIYGHCGATQQLVRFWRGNDHYYGSNNTEAEVIFEESFRNLTGVIKAERSLCYIWP